MDATNASKKGEEDPAIKRLRARLKGHMQASGSLPAEIGLTMQGELVLMSGCAQAAPHGAKFSEARV